MQHYKTVEEKSTEWNLSSRHVQYLCRNGKIAGAIKHAEVWFIPGDAPSPAKKTKPDDSGFRFVGTRKRIFYAAVNLFVNNGFENVSLRDIAAQVGIRQSTIYNHFKSKQGILDAIYQFYCHFYLEDRPRLEDLEARLQHVNPLDIIRLPLYDFKEDYLEIMSDITKIIFQRIGIDERAREIAKTLMVDEGTKFVEDVFDRAVEMGRFSPFDTHLVAVFINCVRIFTLYNRIIDPSPDRMMKLLQDEQALYRYAAGLLAGGDGAHRAGR